MSEISIFIDESGTQEMTSSYYLVTLVFHDQSDSIQQAIGAYESKMEMSDLPLIPFHATPLLRAHSDYAAIDVAERGKMLSAFAQFVRKLPVAYHTFIYSSHDFSNTLNLQAELRKDIVTFLFDHLEYFQSFDTVKVYYDDGQPVVTRAVHAALEYALARNTTLYRESKYRNYYLAQAADYICAIELTARKYLRGEQTPTDCRFFGGNASFKKNWLKQVRRKRFE